MENLKKFLRNFMNFLLLTITICFICLFLLQERTYKVSISCERASDLSGSCEISKFNFRKEIETETVAIQDIKKVRVKTDFMTTLSNGGTVVKKVVLKTRGKEIYLGSDRFSFNHKKVSYIAEKLNIFLRNKEQKAIRIDYSDLWEKLLYAILSIALGIWVLGVSIFFCRG